MRDDTTLGVDNVSYAVIADLGLLHNFLNDVEIEFDHAHTSVAPRTGQPLSHVRF